MLNKIDVKNMTTRKMVNLILILEKEIEFRESIGEEIAENKKKTIPSPKLWGIALKKEVTIHKRHMQDMKEWEKRADTFIEWRNSFADAIEVSRHQFKTRNFLDQSTEPFE